MFKTFLVIFPLRVYHMHFSFGHNFQVYFENNVKEKQMFYFMSKWLEEKGRNMWSKASTCLVDGQSLSIQLPLSQVKRCHRLT